MLNPLSTPKTKFAKGRRNFCVEASDGVGQAVRGRQPSRASQDYGESSIIGGSSRTASVSEDPAKS